jgi:pimeloyl-[acyl-carrier protein] methyl ester esterase
MALRAMAARLERGEVQDLFEDFRVQVAAPQSVENLPAGVEDGPISAIGRQRLIEDLALLGQCTGLPEAFPKGAAVLIVEAEADTIVHPLSRQALRAALPQASLRSLPGMGHSLLMPTLAEQLLDWLEKQ